MKICGWNIIDVFDGAVNVKGVVQALLNARVHEGRPTFINIRTIIGLEVLAKARPNPMVDH
jgi:dihydroxyacetone synthase